MPLTTHGPQMAVTEPLPYAILPVIGVASSIPHEVVYLRQVKRGNIVFGGGSRGPASADTSRAYVLPENTLAQFTQISRLVPALDRLNIIRVWSGVESYLPDDIPIMGPSAKVSGLYYAFGFCGHGFQLGPGRRRRHGRADRNRQDRNAHRTLCDLAFPKHRTRSPFPPDPLEPVMSAGHALTADSEVLAFHKDTYVFDGLSIAYVLDEKYSERLVAGGVDGTNVTFALEEDWDTVLRNAEQVSRQDREEPLPEAVPDSGRSARRQAGAAKSA